MRCGSLFSGIGGLDLGLERAGFEVAWSGQCLASTRQPVSFADRGLAQKDERWLWPEFHRIVRLLRPRFVLVENVPGLLARGMGDVLGDLAASGYNAEWDCIPAAAVGAPHLRYRVFIVAHRQADASRPDTNGLGSHRAEVDQLGTPELRDGQERRPGSVGATVADSEGCRLRAARGSDGNDGHARVGGQPLAHPASAGLEGRFQSPAARTALTESARRNSGPGGTWATESHIRRVAHGVPSRVDRLRGLGNAVVPQVAEYVGRCLMEMAA